jgi:hypothetical protein
MPADWVSGQWTIPPGNQVVCFTFSGSPQPNIGPVVCIFSPSHPMMPEDVKMTIDPFSVCRSVDGPVYYYGLISNSCSQTVMGRLMCVWFPEFQTDWEM